MNKPTIEGVDRDAAIKWANEAISHYERLLADMDYSAELVAAEHNAAQALLSALKDSERYRWLREKHDAGDEQAFVYGAKGKLDDYIDAERGR